VAPPGQSGQGSSLSVCSLDWLEDCGDEPIFNPVAIVEVAIEKGAASISMPISSRRQLNYLPDELAAKITIHYYLDARDALLKALAI
jgi:predicted ATP-dependent Lon-type protease